MNEEKLERITSVLAQTKREGDRLRCTFICPKTGFTIEASAPVPEHDRAAEATAGLSALSNARRGLMGRVRASLKRSVSGALESRMVRHGAREALSGVAEGLARGRAGDVLTPREKGEAVAMAFAKVASHFRWDEALNAYVHAGNDGVSGSSFFARLANHPIRTRHDRELLARVLVRLAAADGKIDAAEGEFLKSFLGDEPGAVPGVLSLGEPASEDLEKVASRPVAANILMVAWALAMTDEKLTDSERAFLESVRQGFGLSEEETTAARQDAAAHVFEQALDAAFLGAHRDPAVHAEALSLARGIGLTPAAAKEVEADFRERNSL